MQGAGRLHEIRAALRRSGRAILGVQARTRGRFGRIALIGLCALVAQQANASQDEDARVLIELFADAENFMGAGPYALTLDGCDATLQGGFHHHAFLLSSIDFEAMAQNENANSLALNEDARRQVDAWQDGRSELPRSPLGWDLAPYATEEEREATRKAVTAYNEAYYAGLLGGVFGEWYRRHHHYILSADGGRQRFDPVSWVILRMRPDRRDAVLAALADYVERHCLPPPDFSCTPFFVDAPGTVC